LALEALAGVRLPRDRARPAGKAEQSQNRCARRQHLGRTAVDQPGAFAGGQEGRGLASHRSPFAARRRGPSIDGPAAPTEAAADTNDQQGATSAAEAQSPAGMPGEGLADAARAEVAGRTAAVRDRPDGIGSALSSMGTLEQATAGTGADDPRTTGGKRNGADHRHGARGRGVGKPRVGQPHRRNRPVSARQESPEVLGPDATIEQLGGCDPAAGLDHQGRQRHREIRSRANGVARTAARRRNARVVPPDQAAAGSQDRPSGRDAPIGDGPLVHDQIQAGLSVGRNRSEAGRSFLRLHTAGRECVF